MVFTLGKIWILKNTAEEFLFSYKLHPLLYLLRESDKAEACYLDS